MIENQSCKKPAVQGDDCTRGVCNVVDQDAQKLEQETVGIGKCRSNGHWRRMDTRRNGGTWHPRKWYQWHPQKFRDWGRSPWQRCNFVGSWFGALNGAVEESSKLIDGITHIVSIVNFRN